MRSRQLHDATTRRDVYPPFAPSSAVPSQHFFAVEERVFSTSHCGRTGSMRHAHLALGDPANGSFRLPPPCLELLQGPRHSATPARCDVAKATSKQLLYHEPSFVIALPRWAKGGAGPQHLGPALGTPVAWSVGRADVHELDLRGPATTNTDPLVVRGDLVHDGLCVRVGGGIYSRARSSNTAASLSKMPASSGSRRRGRPKRWRSQSVYETAKNSSGFLSARSATAGPPARGGRTAGSTTSSWSYRPASSSKSGGSRRSTARPARTGTRRRGQRMSSARALRPRRWRGRRSRRSPGSASRS